MKKLFKNNFCATAIGSVPHTDAKEICEKILDDYRDIPFWPQMPKGSFFENMYAQFSEGFPGVSIDEDKKRLWVDTTGNFLASLEEAYGKILDEDLEYFSVTEKYASGFHEFLSQARKKDLSSASFIKGHVTGPISFGLSVTDEKKQSILYRQELSEISAKILAAKARYQIRKMKEVFGNIIIFIDEPYLVSIGSSVVNIKRDDAITKITDIIDAIHTEGALAGIHCCGNTDWSLLLGLGLDILNFDAYNFLKSISLYPDALKGFLGQGKMLAWGIVPTQDAVRSQTEDALIKRLKKGIGALEEKGIDRTMIMDSLMVTPSCGCGTMDKKDAELVLELNVRLSDRMRSEYGK